MKRTDAAYHVGNLFQSGNPLTGQRGTRLDHTWLNSVQEELAAPVEAAGIVLDGADTGQLLRALRLQGLDAFDTPDTALAALSTALSDGQQVRVRGYADAADGGGDVWRYDAASTEDVRTGYVAEAPGLPGRFSRAARAKGVFRPQDLGAKMNGLADDLPRALDMFEAADQPGDVVEIAGGRMALDVAATELISARMLAETGVPHDMPDRGAIFLKGRKNLTIRGDATFIQERGAPITALFCEDLVIDGLRFDTGLRPTREAWYDIPEPDPNPNDYSWQATAAYIAYCIDTTIRNIESRAHHRGVMFVRTSGSVIENSRAVDPNYMGFSSYGELFKPSGWTAGEFAEIFERIVYTNDAGIRMNDLGVRNARQFGVYSNGPARIVRPTIDCFADPAISGSSSCIGINASAGDIEITDPRVYTPAWNVARSAAPTPIIGIAAKREDELDGVSPHVHIRGGMIENVTTGISVVEMDICTIRGIDIRNYAMAGISGSVTEGISSNRRIVIEDNTIGPVDPNTLFVGPSHPSWPGGIAFIGSGSGSVIDQLIIERNTFDQQFSAIQDPTARAAHGKAIHVLQRSGQTGSFAPNRILPDSGEVAIATDSVYAGRIIKGVPIPLTEADTATTLPNIKGENAIYAYRGSAGATITMPAYMQAGLTFTIMNDVAQALVLQRNSASHSIAGNSQITITGRSTVVLRCVSDKSSSTAYSLEIESSSVEAGGSITTP